MPGLLGSTKVLLVNGNSVAIKDLPVDSDVEIFSLKVLVDPSLDYIALLPDRYTLQKYHARRSPVVQYSVPMVQVTFRDGVVVRCAPDQKFYTCDQGFLKAVELVPINPENNQYTNVKSTNSCRFVSSVILLRELGDLYTLIPIGTDNYLLGDDVFVAV